MSIDEQLSTKITRGDGKKTTDPALSIPLAVMSKVPQNTKVVFAPTVVCTYLYFLLSMCKLPRIASVLVAARQRVLRVLNTVAREARRWCGVTELM